MQLFGLFCVSAYCLASVVVGIRLVRLASRTREIPELMIGSAFLSGGAVGYPASVAVVRMLPGSPAAAQPMAWAAAVGLGAAAACILMAWWKIYHPARRWAPWAVSLWSALLAAVCVLQMSRPLSAMAIGASPWEALRVIAQGGPYAAIAWSGFRYHAVLRRRLRLGLADPVVANRIWLWNIAASAVTLQYGYIWAAPHLDSLFHAVSATPAFVGTLGVLMAVCIMHAFYPPQGYLRWIKRRAGVEAS